MSKTVTLALAAASMGALMLTTGCSGPQTNGESGDGCPAYTSAMSGAALSEAVICHQQAPTADTRELCVAAVGRAADLTPEAVGVAANCMLEAQERTDGALLADAFYAVSTNPDQTEALANALAPHFDAGVHGNTFAVALSRDAQSAIGGVLEALEPESRDMIVELALTFALDPLSGFCAPYVQARGVDDPVVQSYAAGINQSQALNETERWVLAATGEWDAGDVLACADGELAACADETEASPLELLAAVTESGGPQPPSQALDALRLGDLTPEETSAITAFLSNTSYSNRTNYINTIMGLMNNPERPIEMRDAMAEGAGALMCEFERARTYTRAAQSAVEDRQAPSPWNTFVSRCNEAFWGPSDRVGALSMGSWLHVSDALTEALESALNTSTEGWTCDQYLALNTDAFAHRDTVPMAGLGVVALATIAPDSCADAFDGPVREVLEDDDAHPEARLAAVAYLLDLGDDSGCRHISSAMNWYHSDLMVGPSPEAEAMRDALEPRCE